MQKKEVDRGYIKWFSEIHKADGPIAGGKGANLGEMYNSGFPVPPGFVITTKAFHYFLEKAGLVQKIEALINSVNMEDTTHLENTAKKIKEMIVASELPQDLQADIVESYDHFNIDLNNLNGSPDVLRILKNARESVFVSVRSSATAEDLGDASFAGQQESFINVKGNYEVIEKVKRVFASIFTARSIYYRRKKGFEDIVGIAAVVQKMVNSDKSGVMFSLDPVKHENILIEAVFGQGEGIVSGRIKPDSYVVSTDLEILEEHIFEKKVAIVRDSSGATVIVPLTEERSKQKVLKNWEIKKFAEYGMKLQKHYGDVPQDVEFAVEGDELYILQTRPVTTLKNIKTPLKELTGKILTEGLAASPGIGSGPVKIVLDLSHLGKVQKGDVLVTTMTNPDMVITMQKAAAIITDEGGVTAHAAIVSREMGIPAVVGTGNATHILKDGMEVTVDGFNGKVYLGRTSEAVSAEVKPIVPTKTSIKVTVDLPEFAERAAKTNANGVGLVRIEGIIASSGKHPLFYKHNNTLKDYTTLLTNGLEKIASSFKGKQIWVRSSDIRCDEFANLEGAPKKMENNPMMGLHGIRFSLKYPDIFKAELQAVKILVEKGHHIGIMFPQIISPEEVKAAKKVMEEMGLLQLRGKGLKVGVMIETPAACVLIRDICECGIDFISFGTNDLTQFTLAIDRGNEDVQYLYDEMNWAILKQLSRVIRTCKEYKVETSICGQAGSKKEMVEYLVKQGIDSLSTNADATYDISVFVKELEEKAGLNLNELPVERKQEKMEIQPLPISHNQPIQPVHHSTPPTLPTHPVHPTPPHIPHHVSEPKIETQTQLIHVPSNRELSHNDKHFHKEEFGANVETSLSEPVLELVSEESLERMDDMQKSKKNPNHLGKNVSIQELIDSNE